MERKAIVLAAAGQSYTERNVAQALPSTFPINLGVTKEFAHVMDDCDEPLMPFEEQSVSEVDCGEIDALITNFETLSNTTEESCPIDEEEAVRTLVTWKDWTLQQGLPRTSPEEASVPGKSVGDERGPLCKSQDKGHWTSSFWRLNSCPSNVRHPSQMSQMKRKKHVFCFMSQEKPSSIQVVEDALVEH